MLSGEERPTLARSKLVNLVRSLPEVMSPAHALVWLKAELEQIRQGTVEKGPTRTQCQRLRRIVAGKEGREG